MAKLEDPLPRQESPIRRASVDADYPVYVVIGTGPVGIRCAQKLLEYGDRAQVVVYGAEAEAPYNRVKLSQYLATTCRSPISTTRYTGKRTRGWRNLSTAGSSPSTGRTRPSPTPRAGSSPMTS